MGNYEDQLLKAAKPLDEFVKRVIKEHPEVEDIDQYWGSWNMDGLQDAMHALDRGDYEGSDDE